MKYRCACVCASLFSVMAAASAMYQSDFLHLKFHATQGWLSMQHFKSEVAHYTLRHSAHGDFSDSHVVTIILYPSLRKHDQCCLWKSLEQTCNVIQLDEWFGHFPNMWKVPGLRLGENTNPRVPYQGRHKKSNKANMWSYLLWQPRVNKRAADRGGSGVWQFLFPASTPGVFSVQWRL